VTSFTASDFGRTLTGTDGSDHGWGGSHFILGGAVDGGRFYGTAPVIANNGPDDVPMGPSIVGAPAIWFWGAGTGRAVPDFIGQWQ